MLACFRRPKDTKTRTCQRKAKTKTGYDPIYESVRSDAVEVEVRPAASDQDTGSMDTRSSGSVKSRDAFEAIRP